MLLKLLWRNAFRHKLRTALTILGMCVAILAFGLLRTVIDAWHSGVEAAAADRLVTRNAISLIFNLPLSYHEKIRAVDGVKRVSYGNWFGGIYIDEKNFFANLVVEPRSYFEMYPEYTMDDFQRESFLRDRKGCVVGRKLVRRFGWKLGDPITLKGTIFPGNWEMVIRAIYKGKYDSTDEGVLFFHWEYLNETLKKTSPRRADNVGFYVIEVTHPDRAAQVAGEVDQMFRNSRAETLTETERAFQMGFLSMSEALITAIRLISLVVIFIIMAVVANTMIMSVRERMGEYAVLKTLGFGALFLSILIFGESLVICGLGGGLGILMTFPVADLFRQQVGDYFPTFIVKDVTLLLDAAAAILVGTAAGILPAWRASRVRISEGLRRLG